MKKIISTIIAVVVCAGILITGYYLLSETSPQQKTLTVAIDENAIQRSPILLMKENHILEKYLPSNVKIEWAAIDNSADLRDALATNRATIGLMNIKVIAAIEKGYPISVLANGMGFSTALYTTNPNITKPADLAKADKIAASRGGSSLLAFRWDMKATYGIELRDDQILEVGDEDLVNMLISDKVDASLLTPTEAAIATAKRTDIRQFYDITPVMKEIGLATWLCANEQFMDDNPELLDPILAAYSEAVNTINADPAAVAEQLSAIYKVPPTEIEQELRSFPPIVEMFGYDQIAQILYENGELQSPPKPFNQLPNYETIPKKDN